MTDTSKSPVDPMDDYRKFLIAAELKTQEDFDKTVLSLSGGALGISFVFLKDVIGANPIAQPFLLLMAWISWAFSTFAVLASYYLSHLALRKAIAQVDDKTIRGHRPGGALAVWTAILNGVGAVLFLAGVCCITAFAGFNLSTKGVGNATTENTVIPASAATIPSASTPGASFNSGQPSPANRGVHSSQPTASAATK